MIKASSVLLWHFLVREDLNFDDDMGEGLDDCKRGNNNIKNPSECNMKIT